MKYRYPTSEITIREIIVSENEIVYGNKIFNIEDLYNFQVTSILGILTFKADNNKNLSNFLQLNIDRRYKNDYEELALRLNTIVYSKGSDDLMASALMYVGGHPLITEPMAIIFRITNEKFILQNTINNVDISMPISYIKKTEILKQEEIERRYTATRLLFLGFFALAFKKKTVTTNEFLAIEILDNSKQEFVIIFSGKTILDIRKKLFELIQTNSNEQKETGKSNITKLKEFKELLDLNIITQDEFDKKKKELLELL